ncbi:MFS transporter [Anatilimnocola sp. NA78]|uniref:MFS transporter n=1 Tax=Anatilimnocola sp. NA78 TaxID=3415683 RepID=UPI003CE4D121
MTTAQSNPHQSPAQLNQPMSSRAAAVTPGGYVAAFSVMLSAALVMAATIPGRTQGLALITEHLKTDFQGLTNQNFAWINCWGTLIGGLFCLPCGWLLDRVAPKYFALITMAALAFVTLGMSQAHDTTSLMVYITLTRGLGQSMLSVISITLMAKWFRRDSSVPMAGYAVAMTMLMVVGFGLLQSNLSPVGLEKLLPDWRPVWAQLGWALLVMAPIAALLCWPVTAGRKPDDATAVSFASASLWTALGTSCFWVFSLSISLFGMVSSGVTLFQQEIFAGLGLDVKVFYTCQLIGLGVGLLANFVTGYLARKVSLSLLLGIAMSVFAGSLITLPLLRTAEQAYLQAVVYAFAGGAIVVLFYLIWVHAYGPKHVGSIQGAVQWMTVVTSALGPPFVIEGSRLLGGYTGIIWAFAAFAALLAITAFLSRVPVASRGDWQGSEPAETRPANYQLSQETN